MDTQLIKRTKIVLFFILTIAILGGVGLWWYWPSGPKPETVQRPTPTPAPVEEKKVEIIKNPNGSRTFYNYPYKYKFIVPDGWNSPKPPFGNPDYIQFSDSPTASENGIANIHIRVNPQNFSEPCLVRADSTETTINIGGQWAERCYFKFQFSQFSEIKFTKDNTNYAILIEIERTQATEDPDLQTILNSFEFLE